MSTDQSKWPSHESLMAKGLPKLISMQITVILHAAVYCVFKEYKQKQKRKKKINSTASFQLFSTISL